MPSGEQRGNRLHVGDRAGRWAIGSACGATQEPSRAFRREPAKLQQWPRDERTQVPARHEFRAGHDEVRICLSSITMSVRMMNRTQRSGTQRGGCRTHRAASPSPPLEALLHPTREEAGGPDTGQRATVDPRHRKAYTLPMRDGETGLTASTAHGLAHDRRHAPAPQDRHAIVQATAEVAGPAARALLFGSRTDDHARGGDIDLRVELPQAPADPLGCP